MTYKPHMCTHVQIPMLPKRKRSWGISEQKIVAASQRWKCACCQELLTASFEIDHIKSLWNGGSDDAWTNAQALCGTCHSDKTQRERAERTRQRRQLILAQKIKRARYRSDAEQIESNPFMCFALMP